MPFAKLPDADIHYEIKGHGEPVMLVAGLGGAASYWNPNLDAFTQAYQVMLHDHRGTGQSTRCEMDYSVELMADDLLRTMDAAGIDKAHLVGHSTGGAIGVATALDYPDRISRMMVYASTTHGDAYRRKILGLRSVLFSQLGIEAYAQYSTLLLYPPYWINGHESEIAEAEGITPDQLGSAEVQSSRFDAILKFDRRAELSRIAIPTLVVCADDDILTPRYFSEEYVRLIPGARAHFVPRGGHALSRTEPDLFESIAIGFFQGDV